MPSSSDRARAQTWSPDSYDEHARFVSDLAGEVLNWLAARPGERIPVSTPSPQPRSGS